MALNMKLRFKSVERRNGGGLNRLLPLFFIFLPFVCLGWSLGVGQYPLSLERICRILAGQMLPLTPDWNELEANLLLYVRLPRVLAAMLVGAALAMSGAAFQGLFRNPLASPYTLGVSNGAGFGAALGIVVSTNVLVIYIGAFACSLLAVALTFIIGGRGKGPAVSLVLGGIVVGAFFAALISLLKYVADPFEKLPAIVFWLMGSLAAVKGPLLAMSVPLFAAGVGLLFLYRWRLNLLCMGDDEAAAFGVEVRRDRIVVVFCCTLITAASVSLCGIVGWVGLVIPHFARMLVGPDFRKLLPACFSLGASYLVLMDNLCRTLTQAEIPLGVVTALVGTPVFAWFMLRRRTGW